MLSTSANNVKQRIKRVADHYFGTTIGTIGPKGGALHFKKFILIGISHRGRLMKKSLLQIYFLHIFTRDTNNFKWFQIR